MSEQPFKNPSLTATEQLSNLYDSLAEDALDGFIEIDEETYQRADRIFQAVSEKMINSGENVNSGAKVESQRPRTSHEEPFVSRKAEFSSPKQQRTKVLARRFGLHPGLAGALTGVSIALITFAWGTFGGGTLLELPLIPVFGFLTLMLQMRIYGDNLLTALLKGVAVTLILAIPIPLAPFLFIPAGVLGGIGRKMMKSEEKKVDQVVANSAPEEQVHVNLISRDGSRRERERTNDNK